MRALFVLSILVGASLLGCGEEKLVDLTYKGPQPGKCFAFEDEAIKVIGVSEGRYYYKHSWNNQDEIFESSNDNFLGYEISCGRDGYEFEVLAYSIKSMKIDLESLTQSLKKVK